jgi:hypothetical protein
MTKEQALAKLPCSTGEYRKASKRAYTYGKALYQDLLDKGYAPDDANRLSKAAMTAMLNTLTGTR